MKIFLLHGDDSIKSLDRLMKFTEEAKKRSWEVIYLDESHLTIAENISSSALFGEERFFVHRDFKKLKKSDLDYVNKRYKDFNGNLVFYSDSAVPKTFSAKLPKDTKIEEFKLPFLVWKLLDNFYPGNAKNFLVLLHQVTETQAVEFVFGLLAKLLRDLYWVKVDASSLNYPDWRVLKIKAQSNKFSKVQLEEIISNLAGADVKSKTSNSDLLSLLDFVVFTQLK